MTAQGTSLLRNTVTLTGICTLLCAAACDSFLVPTCSFYTDRKGCPDTGWPSGDSGADSDGPPDPITPQDMPNPVEPNFKWAASIALNSTTKYVGIVQDQAITWNSDTMPNYLKSWILKLDILGNPPDEITGQKCSNCANLATLADTEYNTDQIYVAGNNYWKLKFHNDYNLAYFDNGSRSIIPGLVLDGTQKPRAFFHPLKNSLVIEVNQAPGLSMAGIAVIQNKSLVLAIANTKGRPTALTLGDLDSIDKKNQLDEIILFSGNVPLTVLRPTPDQLSRYDDELSNKLAIAISSTKTDDSPIDAAFIADLNNDRKADFIYIRKGAAFVTTYTGNYQFQNWAKPIPLLETTGETIRSLSAVDITKDNLPELVVETDKAVHFYVNQP